MQEPKKPFGSEGMTAKIQAGFKEFGGAAFGQLSAFLELLGLGANIGQAILYVGARKTLDHFGPNLPPPIFGALSKGVEAMRPEKLAFADQGPLIHRQAAKPSSVEQTAQRAEPAPRAAAAAPRASYDDAGIKADPIQGAFNEAASGTKAAPEAPARTFTPAPDMAPGFGM